MVSFKALGSIGLWDGHDHAVGASALWALWFLRDFTEREFSLGSHFDLPWSGSFACFP